MKSPVGRAPNWSRRSLLAGALGGFGAATAGAISRSTPVGATPQYVVLGDSNTETHRTSIQNTNASGFFASAAGGAIGVEGDSETGYGVYGFAKSGGYGVYGTCDNGSGVYGTSQSGFGVEAHSDSNSAVYAASGSVAVDGRSNLQTAIAVQGWNAHAGVAVEGFSTTGTHTPYSSSQPIGVYGVADVGQAAIGVRGESPTGRGAVFVGHIAQVRLAPSTAKTHPASGKAGDLFLDNSARLWLCKGGQTWHLLG